MTLADVAVVDAPVIMQLKFQQSFVVSLDVPQIPFIDRVVDIPVGIDLQKTVEIPQLQFLDLVVMPVCATTSLVQTVQKTVELPQVQLLWCVDVLVIMLLVPAVQSYVFRAIQSDRVPDIPVMLTVQFLNKVVDMVMYDRCPWFDSAEFVHRQGRRHPWFRTVAVPQIQSSTELNDVFEAVLAYFSDSPARG